VVVPPERSHDVIAIFHSHGIEASVIGRAVSDPDRNITIPALKVVGRKDKFYVV
jgi:hypothetical protein